MSTSERFGYTRGSACEVTFAGSTPTRTPTPETAPVAVFLIEEADVSSAFGGQGRPSDSEVKLQEREYLRLLAGGASVKDAQKGAGISPLRALYLHDEPTFRAVFNAIRDSDSGPLAVRLEQAA